MKYLHKIYFLMSIEWDDVQNGSIVSRSIPFAYNDSMDTKTIQNIILIDDTVQGYQKFVEGCNVNTFPIVYNYHSDRNELKKLLANKFSNIHRMAFVFHNSNMKKKRFLNNQYFFSESETPDNFSKNLQGVIDIIRDFGIGHLDYLACNSLHHDTWKQYFDIMKTTTNVVIGASNHVIGNTKYGGDWVMDTTNENVKSIYFDDSIDAYAGILGDLSTPTITVSIQPKTYGDTSFTITDISSNSQGAFHYDSSDITVAIIDGNVISVTGPGSTVITVTQDACGNYLDGSASCIFYVNPSVPTTTTNYSDGSANVPFIVASMKIGLKSSSFNSDGDTKTFPQIAFHKDTTAIQDLSYNNGNYTAYYTTEPLTSLSSAYFQTDLLYVNLGHTITSIGDYAFSGCSSLVSIYLPMVTNIGINAFYGCQSIIAYTLHKNNYIITYSAYPAGSIIIPPGYVVKYAPSITNFNIPTKTYGTDFSFILQDPSSNSQGAFTYQSSNTSIATINDKIVTITGVGSSDIIVTQDACGNYLDGSANAALTVIGAVPTAPSITKFNIPTKTYGDASFAIVDPSSNSQGAFTYQSSNTSVATISGKIITIISAGSSTITVRQDACGNYLDGSANITFNVNQAIPTIRNFNIPAKTYGDAPFAIVDPSSNSQGAFTYQSFNQNVATISGKTITILKAGSSTINLKQDACGNYTNGFANITLKINTIIPTIRNFNIPVKTFGDAPFAIVDPSSDSSGNFTYTSSNTSVATINGKTITITGIGRTTITVTQSSTENYAGASANAILYVFSFNFASKSDGFNSDVDTKSVGGVVFNKDTNAIQNSYYNNGNYTLYYTTTTITDLLSSYFQSNQDLLYVNLGNSITSIGNNAFDHCSSLVSINLTNRIISIGNNAFDHCSSLTSISLPNSVMIIGSNAFNSCSLFTSLTLPIGVVNVGDSAFKNCYNLTTITVFSIAPFIGPNAFSGTSSTITMFGYIPNNLFANVTTIKTLIVNTSVTNIGKSAFQGCSNLNKMNFTRSIQFVGTNAFAGTSSELTISGYLPNNLLYNVNSVTTLIIDANIPSIGSNTFNNCPSLTNITIRSSSITSIGQYAFTGLPESITLSGYIPSNIFAGVATIKNVMIGSNISVIGNSAFANCKGITSINIPSNVTAIGASAFQGCSNLRMITLSSIVSIGTSVFFGLPASITVSGFIPSNMFSGITTLKNITIGTNITSIGASAFQGCSGITSIIIPSNVTALGASAFQGCSNLKMITISSIVSVGTSVFLGLPASITLAGFIPSNAFIGLTKLTNIVFQENTNYIGASAFQGCSNIRSLTIPDNVTYIGASAFQGCSTMRSINVSNRIQSINASVFEGCSNVAAIIIPNSIRNIDQRAFYGCSSMLIATIPPNVTSIGASAFKGCSDLINFYFLCNNNFDLMNIIDNQPKLTIYYTNNTTGWASLNTQYKLYPAPLITNKTSKAITGTSNTKNVYVYNVAKNKYYVITSRNGSWTYAAQNGRYSTVGFFYDDVNYSSYCKSMP
jgi:BspA type Leucine rich repeat region (6 copies)/Domain of unknown function (DUF4347)/Bacterial Ig-like domain (group 2)